MKDEQEFTRLIRMRSKLLGRGNGMSMRPGLKIPRCQSMAEPFMTSPSEEMGIGEEVAEGEV